MDIYKKYNANGFDFVSLANGVLGGIFSGITIGDNVKAYPIKSENTFNGIVSDIKKNFPPPYSYDNALSLLDKVDLWVKSAEDKIARNESVAVNQTYKMMLEELAVQLALYLKGQPFTYPQYNTGGKSYSGVDISSILNQITVPGYTEGQFDGNTPIQPQTAGIGSNIGWVILIVIVLFLFNAK